MAKKIINDNDLFIATTDTVIGIGGKVNDVVLNKIYEIKQRDRSKKIVIVVSSIKQLKKLEQLNKNHLKYIKNFWPGDTTLIINNNAYRMPDNKGLLKFIKKEGPFYLTSANITNHKPVKSKEEANNIFPNIIFFDFGLGSGKPSKIIDTETGNRLR